MAKGKYFPNVFSPNTDWVNDACRPRVNGLLISYRLQMYNRFGQMVISSTDYRQSWDGKINGKLQDANTYVWVCSWQFIPVFNRSYFSE